MDQGAVDKGNHPDNECRQHPVVVLHVQKGFEMVAYLKRKIT
jgi:hypothetical protein